MSRYLSNYPPGVTDADFDDPDMTEFEHEMDGECSMCLNSEVALNDDGVCDECFEPEEIEEEDDEDDGDRAYDAWKDQQLEDKIEKT